MNWSWLARTRATHSTAIPVGANAERMAETYLENRGLRLLQRNFSCKLGEIDLIMEDQETLVFVEVRFRKQAQFGSPVETVTRAKQRKLLRAAQHYLLGNKAAQTRPMRFDVIGVAPKFPGEYDYTWIQHAFDGEQS